MDAVDDPNTGGTDLSAGDFPGYSYTGPSDDIIIFYAVRTDLPSNVLGSAGPNYVRSAANNYQPISGSMFFNKSTCLHLFVETLLPVGKEGVLSVSNLYVDRQSASSPSNYHAIHDHYQI